MSARQYTKLAEQTANSITGIEAIIGEVGNAIEKTQDYMEQGTQAANRTTEVSMESSASTEEISMSLEEQSSSLEDVNQSAQELQEVSYELEHLVGQFKL